MILNSASEKHFLHVDRLFDTIEPKKFAFMAVDRVAPRVEMDQQ